MKNPYQNVARGVAKVGVQKYKPKIPKGTRVGRGRTAINVRAKPPRPYPTRNAAPKPLRPTTQTPTISSTGVTTTSQGNMPGAPGSPDTSVYSVPKVKNWAKATPAQIAQSMLAPQYASLAAQQHQSAAQAKEQQAAIQSYGLDLAKILGTAGPGGSLPTIGPNYAAALSMDALRHFAYNQAQESAKFADEYAKIAAQYPTYLNQILAQKADDQRKDDAFALQKLVAYQTYHLNVQKTKSYDARAKALTAQGNQRISIAKFSAITSRKNAQLAVAKWNQSVTMDANKIDLRLSQARKRYVNAQGNPIPALKGQKPPPYYKPGSPGSPKGGGGLTPNERASILDKATNRATQMYSTLDPIENVGGHKVMRPEAYRNIRRYLHLQFPKMKAAQLNALTEDALTAAGYRSKK